MIASLLTLLVSSAAPVELPLDAAGREGLARHAVTAAAHGKSLSCEGVLLADLLRRAGVLPEGKLASAALDHVVVVEARDGYRVAYSLAEIDPGTGNHPVFLVDRSGKAPIDAADGPLRLVAPEDERPARWVRQVSRIIVQDPE